MSGEWKQIATLVFKGPRSRDHALDVYALEDIIRFQGMVTETAKALWRSSNPARERVPKGFEEATRLFLRDVEDGSAIAPLEMFFEETPLSLFEQEAPLIVAAADRIRQTFRALDRDEPLPADVPRTLLSEYQEFGQALDADDAIEIRTEIGGSARVTQLSRSRLVTFLETPYTDFVDLTGEVLEADVRRRVFQIWTDERTCVQVPFTPQQEAQVTEALRDHQTRRARVTGRASFSSGRPNRMTDVTSLWVLAAGETQYDPTARPIEAVLAELASELPREEWDRLPADLVDNLDHYLYGTPKP
jgi:hypothetical protein